MMIDPALRAEAEAIFNDLVAESPARHAALLEARCGSQHALREEVERLLRATDAVMGDFMRGPRVSAAPERVGRYQIERQIGEGGMGLVYAARQQNPDRQVALKLLRPGLVSGAVLRRFQHEVKALAALQHAAIAHIYEAGTVEMTTGGARFEQPYFAMELIRGAPVTAYARREELSVSRRLELLAAICDAVQHAHQKGIIHRDLKPANILVDDAGHPKVLDFGVARIASTDSETRTQFTAAGQLVGTLAYMSPEQLAGSEASLDTRSDVYALGVIGYELLAGKLPIEFAGLPIPAAIRVATEQDRPKLGSARRELRGDIEAIIGRAMEREPDRRYASSAEFATDIRRFLNQEPVIARRASAAYQVRKFARRHRGLVAGAAAALLALVVGSIATATFAFRAERAAEDARRNADSADTVVTFVHDMFDSLDPALSHGRDVTVREVVDRAAARLAVGQGTSEPQVESTLQSIIGTAYLQIGDPAAARPHFERAVDLIRRTRGSFDPALPENLTSLGEALALLGELEPAARCNAEALTITEKLYDAHSPEVAMALGDLGVAVSRAGEPKEAEALHRRSLAIRRADLDTKPELLAQGLSNLGTVLIGLGPPEEAESVLRESLDIRRRVLDANHPDLAASLNNLGTLLKDRGRLDEAEAMLLEALRIRRAIFRPTDPILAPTLNNLAVVLQRRGRPAESVPLLREALEIIRASQGPDTPELAKSMLNMAVVMLTAGDIVGARQMNADALDILRRKAGPDSPAVGAALHNFGATQIDQGDLENALENLREALRIFELRFGADNLNTAHARDTLGVALNALERFEEAVPLLEKSLADRKRELDAADDKIGRSLMNLAIARLGTGQAAEALDAAQTAATIFRAVGGAPAELSTALLVEAEAGLALDRTVQCHGLINESEQLRRAKFGDDSWQVADAQRVLGRCKRHFAEYAAGETELLRAFEILNQPGRFVDPRAATARRKTILALVELYHAWERPELAAYWSARD